MKVGAGVLRRRRMSFIKGAVMKKIIVVLISMLLVAVCCPCAAVEANGEGHLEKLEALMKERLLPIRENGKTGLIDQSGRVVVEPRYDYIMEDMFPTLGLIAVANGEVCDLDFLFNMKEAAELPDVDYDCKWGFVDREGNEVIAPQFDLALMFNEGLGAVGTGRNCQMFFQMAEPGQTPGRDYDCKWGYIDGTGQYVIPPRYDATILFVNGLAPVALDGKWGVIDTTGRELLPLEYDSVDILTGWSIFMGQAPDEPFLIRVVRDGKHGVADVKGNIILPAEYDEMTMLGKNLIAVCRSAGDGSRCKWGATDLEGNEVYQPQFDFIEQYASDDALIVRVGLGEDCDPYGYMDEGGDCKTGFLDTEGHMVLAPQLDALQPLDYDEEDVSKQLFLAGKNKLWGLLRGDGKMLAWPEYLSLFRFNDDLIGVRNCVCENTEAYDAACVLKWGFLNEQGEERLPTVYDAVAVPALEPGEEDSYYNYSERLEIPDGQILLLENGLWGAASRNGELIVTPQYEFVDSFSEGLAPVRKNGKWGFVNENWDVVIQPKYGMAAPFSDGLALVGQGDCMPGMSTDYYPEECVPPGDEETGETPDYGKMDIDAAYPEEGSGYDLDLDEEYEKYMEEKGVEAGASFEEYLKEPEDEVLIDGAGYDTGAESGDWKEYEPCLMGYIDKKGAPVVPLEYEDARSFSGGLAAVFMDGKWGYIDTSGRMAIQPAFSSAGDFENGLAEVDVYDDESGSGRGLVDKTGKYAVPPKYEFIRRYTRDATWVMSDNKWGLLGHNGKMIVPLRYDGIEMLYDADYEYTGASVCENDENEKCRWGAVDLEGRVMVKPAYDTLYTYGDSGLIQAGFCDDETMECRHGLVDRKGRVVVAPKYQYINVYAHGDILHVTANGDMTDPGAPDTIMGVLDRQGGVLLKMEYEDIIPFFDDGQLLGAYKQGKFSIFDVAAGKLHKRVYDAAFSIQDTFVQIGVGGCESRFMPDDTAQGECKWGLMDKRGRIILEPEFDVIDMVHDELIQVKRGNEIGYLNADGKYFRKPSE